MPYEFPDDYSISLEEAMVSWSFVCLLSIWPQLVYPMFLLWVSKATRKEFASAAILKMVTDIMTEIAQGKRVREEMMEAIEDLQGRLKGQHEEDAIQIPLDTTSQHVRDDSKRSESKEKRPKSCRDLQKAGHSLSGFYLVRGKAQQRVDVVFCPFSNDTENGKHFKQRLIGNVYDVSHFFFFDREFFSRWRSDWFCCSLGYHTQRKRQSPVYIYKYIYIYITFILTCIVINNGWWRDDVLNPLSLQTDCWSAGWYMYFVARIRRFAQVFSCYFENCRILFCFISFSTEYKLFDVVKRWCPLICLVF